MSRHINRGRYIRKVIIEAEEEIVFEDELNSVPLSGKLPPPKRSLARTIAFWIGSTIFALVTSCIASAIYDACKT